MSVLQLPDEVWDEIKIGRIMPDYNFKNIFEYKEFLLAAEQRIKGYGSRLYDTIHGFIEDANKRIAEVSALRGNSMFGREPKTKAELELIFGSPFNPWKSLQFKGAHYEQNKEKRDANKTIFEKIGDGIEHLAGEVKNVVEKVVAKVGAVGVAITLAPFKGAMKKALDNRHISHGNDIVDIAKKFYEHVVKHSEQLFDSSLDFTQFERVGNNTDYTFTKATGFENAEGNEDFMKTIANIVKAIALFFSHLLEKAKDAKDKAEKAGVPVSQIAQDLGVTAEAIKLNDIVQAGAHNIDNAIQHEAGQVSNNYARTPSGNSVPKPSAGKSPLIKIGLIVLAGWAAIKYGPKLFKSAA